VDLDMGCEDFERHGVDFRLDVRFPGMMVWFYK